MTKDGAWYAPYENYGWQEDIGVTPIYVMHFPIRGPAAVRLQELEELKQASGNS